ncbi:PTS sugar transporter subunit IIA [Latilactobacillus graminis]|uniref:PTS EIIA type-4 domain-containing protein n=2 Tax=Latilactobacillus graminis TaxID=60519 RepID=A0AA89L0R9_9LACO|nr:hypothetical protein [Latilactobacillus graminis]KRM23664.1 hypothetical protein FC90_GL000128 [Latilactobacillus graminis DSM 20719]
MKPNLLIVSHGNMAVETLKSAEMIVGEIANANTVSMNATDGLSGTIEKIKSQINLDKPTLIMADLLGGTPCNSVVQVVGGTVNCKVISGFNLGMIIEYALCPDMSLEELQQKLILSAKQAIQVVETNIDVDDLDED